MAWCEPNLNLVDSERYDLSVCGIDICALYAGVRRDDRLGAQQSSQFAGTGHVVGMDMCVDGVGEGQAKLGQQQYVSLHVLEYGIDDDGFSAGFIAEQVGVSGRFWLE